MSLISKALHLIISGDHSLIEICQRSLSMAFLSTLMASFIGIPLGLLLGLKSFKGKRVLLVIANSLMALPTVVIGLFIYTLLSQSGPFGCFRLLYTPWAIIIGQTILIIPILISMVHSGVESLDCRLSETLKTLNIRGFYWYFILFSELKYMLISSLIAAFGRVLGEVGISMILGGNIRGFTRTITTTISLQSSMGEFELGMALGLVLMSIAFLLILITHLVVKLDE